MRAKTLSLTIRKFRDARARPGAVSGLKGSGAALRLPVVLKRNHTVKRGAQGKRSQAALIQLYLERRLVVLLLLADII